MPWSWFFILILVIVKVKKCLEVPGITPCLQIVECQKRYRYRVAWAAKNLKGEQTSWEEVTHLASRRIACFAFFIIWERESKGSSRLSVVVRETLSKRYRHCIYIELGVRAQLWILSVEDWKPFSKTNMDVIYALWRAGCGVKPMCKNLYSQFSYTLHFT